jgi:hypothetical protein
MSSHKQITVHTSRTMMFNEFSRIMENGMAVGSFEKALEDNAANKLTKNNQVKTTKYLEQLYGFKASDSGFVSLLHFWKSSVADIRPLLTLVFVVNRDYLLLESIDLIKSSSMGDKVPISLFEENI